MTMQKEVFLTATHLRGLKAWLHQQRWRSQVRMIGHGVDRESEELPPATCPRMKKVHVDNQLFFRAVVHLMWTQQQEDVVSCGACAVNNVLQKDVFEECAKRMETKEIEDALKNEGFNIRQIQRQALDDWIVCSTTFFEDAPFVGMIAAINVTDFKNAHWVALRSIFLDGKLAFVLMDSNKPWPKIIENADVSKWFEAEIKATDYVIIVSATTIPTTRPQPVQRHAIANDAWNGFIWTQSDPAFCGACALNNALQQEVNLCCHDDETKCTKDMSESKILMQIFEKYPHSTRHFLDDSAFLTEPNKKEIVGLIAKVKKSTPQACSWVALRPHGTDSWLLFDSASNTPKEIEDLQAWMQQHMLMDDDLFIAVRGKDWRSPEQQEAESLQRAADEKKRKVEKAKQTKLNTEKKAAERAAKKMGKIFSPLPTNLNELAALLLEIFRLPPKFLRDHSIELKEKASQAIEKKDDYKNFLHWKLEDLVAFDEILSSSPDQIFDSKKMEVLNDKLNEAIWESVLSREGQQQSPSRKEKLQAARLQFSSAHSTKKESPLPDKGAQKENEKTRNVILRQRMQDAIKRFRKVITDADVWDATLKKWRILALLSDTKNLDLQGALSQAKKATPDLSDQAKVSETICNIMFRWIKGRYGNSYLLQDLQKLDCNDSIPILLYISEQKPQWGEMDKEIEKRLHIIADKAAQSGAS